MKIERVVSPKGIEAWLVHEQNVPLIAMQFAFIGGSSQDPEGRPGLSYLLSGMLDEGAGDLESTAFQEKMEELAVRLSFDASRDHFTGNFQTLSENKAEAFDLLRLVITKPRFDKPALERVRNQILSGLKVAENNPSKVAAKAWFKQAFKSHPYGRPVKGDLSSVATLSQDDLRQYHNKIFARQHLKIAVVGDISAEELGTYLDKVFGDLPDRADLMAVTDAEPVFGPEQDVIMMKVPQSVIQFGHQGFKRGDEDFIPAYILNYILGGGGFSSRLMEEVREKRGLAYSIYSYLYPLKKSALFIGGVATKNASVKESISLISSELNRLANEGPTEKELANAKQYLTGSYALRFDTSSKIASQLLGIQLENLGMDYIEKRNGMIEAITMEDIKRVAKRLLHGDKLRFTIVGQPENLAPKSN